MKMKKKCRQGSKNVHSKSGGSHFSSHFKLVIPVLSAHDGSTTQCFFSNFFLPFFSCKYILWPLEERLICGDAIVALVCLKPSKCWIFFI